MPASSNNPDAVELQRTLALWLETWQGAGIGDLPPSIPDDAERMAADLKAAAVTFAAPLAAAKTSSPTSPKAPNSPSPLPPATPKPAAPMPPARPPAPPPRPEPVEPSIPRAKPTAPAPALFAKEAPPSALPVLTAQPPLPSEQRWPALEVIRHEVAGCIRCPQLASTRTQTVFGTGDANARICFVGEAPGADEDAQGVPFIGRAGQLLTKIIEACQLSRDSVFIANVLKCRPPNNRTPEAGEVTNCRGFLDRQLEIVRPEVIVCLGSVAAKCLLNTEVSIGKLRGKWHDYRGLQVYCTYHPAYLLRNPNAKRDVWEDMKVVMQRLGVTL
jgi:uracil-DNA glycosylase family 4